MFFNQLMFSLARFPISVNPADALPTGAFRHA